MRQNFHAPIEVWHKTSVTEKGQLDKRLHTPILTETLCSDVELYAHIKHFCTYPTGLEEVKILDTTTSVTVCKQLPKRVAYLVIAFVDRDRIPAFIANYTAWCRQCKIDKLLTS